MGASPQTPEIFLGITPVFNVFTIRRRSGKIHSQSETDEGHAEMQPSKG